MHFVMEGQLFEAQERDGRPMVRLTGVVAGERISAYLRDHAATSAREAILAAVPEGVRPEQAGLLLEIRGTRRISAKGKPWIDADSTVPLVGPALILHRLSKRAAELLRDFPELPERVRDLLSDASPAAPKTPYDAHHPADEALEAAPPPPSLAGVIVGVASSPDMVSVDIPAHAAAASDIGETERKEPLGGADEHQSPSASGETDPLPARPQAEAPDDNTVDATSALAAQEGRERPEASTATDDESPPDSTTVSPSAAESPAERPEPVAGRVHDARFVARRDPGFRATRATAAEGIHAEAGEYAATPHADLAASPAPREEPPVPVPRARDTEALGGVETAMPAAPSTVPPAVRRPAFMTRR